MTLLTFSRRCVLILVVAVWYCCGCFGQRSELDFRREEADRIEQITKAFTVFLNPRFPDDERVAAVRQFPTVQGEDQLVRLKNIVRDPKESDLIRSTAMAKLKYHVESDETLYRDVLGWVQQSTTSPLLRRECLNTLGILGFTPFGMQAVPDDIARVYRRLTKDPDPDFRRNALNYLAIRGDDYAQQVLIEGLQNPQRRQLDPAESITLLGYDIHGDHYPVIFKVMLETTDRNTLVEAIRVLGNYSPARSKILEYLRDDAADKEIRLAAMKTLNAFAHKDFSEYVEPLLRKKTTPDELLIYAMNAEKYRRDNNTTRAAKYNNGRYVPDSFDRSVQDLRETSTSEAVIKAADIYLGTLNLR